MRVLRPHHNWAFQRSVSAAATASGYTASALVDGWPNLPYKSTSGGAVLTITGALANVDLVVISHHNIITPATITLSGDLTGTVTVAADRPSGIPYNYYKKLTTPVSVSSLTITVAGNPSPVIIGEVLVGLSEQWDLLSGSNSFQIRNFNIQHDDVEVSSVPPYELAMEQRALSGAQMVDDTERVFMEDWMAATRGNSRPSVIIPREWDNDAWVGVLGMTIDYTMLRGLPDVLYPTMSFQFTELKRNRW